MYEWYVLNVLSVQKNPLPKTNFKIKELLNVTKFKAALCCICKFLVIKHLPVSVMVYADDTFTILVKMYKW